jgi:hypothetical protein
LAAKLAKRDAKKIEQERVDDHTTETVNPSGHTLHERDVLEHEEETYKVGDAIDIDGSTGTYTFRVYTKNVTTGASWIEVMWAGHGVRFFHLDKIKRPKRGSSARRHQAKQTRVVLCREHPKYMALRKPRTECVPCWSAYNERQESE